MGVCLSKFKVCWSKHFVPVEDCESHNIEQSSFVTEETKTKFCPFSLMEIVPFENECSLMDFEDRDNFKPIFLSRKYDPDDIITI